MDVSRELLFFFSALGAFNGLLMSLYFIFIAKPKQKSNFFLGMFLLCMSIRIGKSVIFYFNNNLSFIYLQLGLIGCFFIGPFLYFYIRSVTSDEKSILKNWKYHIAILTPIILYINIKYPFEQNIELWRPTIIHGIYYTWLAYSVAALYCMRNIFANLVKQARPVSKLDVWLISIIVGNVIIWCAYYFAGLLSYILGALLFSFFLYLFVMFLIFNKNKDFLQNKVKESYKDKKIEDKTANEIIHNLRSVMKDGELYKNPNLKMQDVANTLKITPHTLSQVVNDNMGIGFPQFLNEYRIEEAKKLIVKHPDNTFESIGYDCGFNSKSTFYATFKKFTDTTPAKYLKSLTPDK